MKTTRIITTITGIILVGAQLGLSQGLRSQGQQGRLGAAAGAGCDQALEGRLEMLPTGSLSDDNQAALLHLREEEKLARDVYATLALEWDIPVFTNIARAEQRHMELVKLLVQRYDLTDPVLNDTIGELTDPALGQLFTDLVAAGRGSLEQALRVGATIEDLDLADLQQLLENTDSFDVKLVVYNLAKGSRNHLRAFARTLAATGFDPYVAQYLDQAQVDEIVTSEQERRVVYDEFGDQLAVTCDGSGVGRGRRGGRGGHGGQGCLGCQGGQGGQGPQGGQGGGSRDGSCAG